MNLSRLYANTAARTLKVAAQLLDLTPDARLTLCVFLVFFKLLLDYRGGRVVGNPLDGTFLPINLFASNASIK